MINHTDAKLNETNKLEGAENAEDEAEYKVIEINEKFEEVYLDVIRKIIIVGVLAHNLLSIGLIIEYNKQIISWDVSRIFELILLFLIIVDIILIYIYVTKLRGILINLFVLSLLAILITIIGLKIWGPPPTNTAGMISISILRVFYTLSLVYIHFTKK